LVLCTREHGNESVNEFAPAADVPPSPHEGKLRVGWGKRAVLLRAWNRLGHGLPSRVCTMRNPAPPHRNTLSIFEPPASCRKTEVVGWGKPRAAPPECAPYSPTTRIVLENVACTFGAVRFRMRTGNSGRLRTRIGRFSVRCERVAMERGFRWVGARSWVIQRGKRMAELVDRFGSVWMVRLTHPTNVRPFAGRVEERLGQNKSNPKR